MASADVVIVGGGVVGCAAAWFLAREGQRVMLLERDELASQASGAAAGMLSPIGEGAPGSPLLRFGLESLSAFPALCEELRERSGIDPELERSGVLRLAQSEGEERALRAKLAALAPLGLELEWLDPAAARARQPGLPDDLRGALWSPAESNLRSPLLARAYAAAARSLGAEIVAREPVVGLSWKGRRVVGARTASRQIATDRVVIATGAWCGALRDWWPRDGAAAPYLPVEPVRGQIVALDGPEPALRTIVWGDRAYLVPKRDGSVVVGATEERVGFDRRLTVSGVAGLLDAASALLPALGAATFQRGWAGLRPGSPDGLPAVGPVAGAEGLLVAVGHFRNGVLLSPTTGALLRDLLVGKDPGPAAEAFAPSRWSPRGDA